jgi:hypothetical protein
MLNQEDINSLLDADPNVVIEQVVHVQTPTPVNTTTELSNVIAKYFKEEYLEALQELDLSKPLKEVINHLEFLESWGLNEDKNVYCKGFAFKEDNKAMGFVQQVLSLAPYIDITSLKDKKQVTVGVKDKDNTDKVEKIYFSYISSLNLSAAATLINPKDSALLESFYEIQLSEEDNMRVIEPYEQDKRFYLKVPVAKLGEWNNIAYGKISFTQKDFEEIVKNFNNDELGFEPPIYYGHSRGKDGHPSQGILVKLEQMGEVLFGYWEVNKDTYRLVEDGTYRYSSAELAYDLPSKTKSEVLKVVLYGMALTNIPFIPNMPRTQALEGANIENNVVWLSFSLDNKKVKDQIDKVLPDKNMADQKVESGATVELELLKTQVEEYAAKVKELELTRQELAKAAEIKTLKDQLQEYSTKFSDYETTKVQLTEAVTQNRELADRLVEYEAKVKEQQVEKKIAEIKQLSLPESMKETYYSLIREGKLGEGEQAVIDSLKNLATSFSSTVLTQSGATATTAELDNEGYVDPYKEEIERCRKILDRRSIK